MRAAHEARGAGHLAAAEAARAAMAAAGAGFLHPLAKATQVKHLLGSAAHAALHRAEDPEHRADHEQDDADGVQDADAENGTEDDQDDAEHDHESYLQIS